MKRMFLQACSSIALLQLLTATTMAAGAAGSDLKLSTRGGVVVQSTARRYSSTELVFKLAPAGADSSEKRLHATEIAARFGANQLEPILPSLPKRLPGDHRAQELRVQLQGVFRMTLPDGSDLLAVVTEMEQLAEVEYAEPVMFFELFDMTNDPYLHTSGSWDQSYQDLWGLHRIGAPQAWETATGEGVVVAVVDSGADPAHPDLAVNLWCNQLEVPGNGVDDDSNGYIDDVNGWDFGHSDNDMADKVGHGTHVAGTIAATGNNGQGVVGVAWESQIMPLAIQGELGVVGSDLLAAAIVYAVDNGASVINMSWGGRQRSELIADALAVAHASGVTLVAAAGNSSEQITPYFPAGSRYVITAGASDTKDARAVFSNFGAGLDVVAPGTDILSLLSSQAWVLEELIVDDEYLRAEGTSMAAPHVTGLAALLNERFPEATPEELRQVIRHAAFSPDTSGWQPETGYGRIDAAAALAMELVGEARIFSPGLGTLTADEVDVILTADAPSLSYVVVEYGSGTNPLEWLPIFDGSAPADHEPVMTWSVRNLPDGVYTMRLRVGGNDSELVDTVELTLDRVEILQPTTHQVFRVGDPLTIVGRASGGEFERFVVAYRFAEDDTWRSEGIELVGQGLLPISNGTLASLDTRHIDTAELCELRLLVQRYGMDPVQDTVQVAVDPDLHAGWPKAITPAVIQGTTLILADHLITADLDANGRSELILGYGAEIRVIQGDGTPLPGWPQPVPLDLGLVQNSPAIADVDGDSDLEVVAATPLGWVMIWHHTGQLMTRWKSDGGTRVVVADLEQDGEAELVMTDWSRGQVSVYDPAGLSLPGWPLSLVAPSMFALSRPAVADIDRDGIDEVIVATNSGEVYALNPDTSYVPGWPVSYGPGGHALLSPILGDVDGDGGIDVVVVNVTMCTIFVFDRHGNALPGWPQRLGDGGFCGSVAAGDLNDDGRYELVAAYQDSQSRGVELAAFTGDGRLIDGWPIDVAQSETPESFSLGVGSPLIADLDGDGRLDVAFQHAADWTWPKTLSAYSSDAKTLAGFPKPVPQQASTAMVTPAVADMDGDGLLELAAIGGVESLFVWDLDSVASGNGLWWPMFQHDPAMTGALPELALPAPRRPNGRRYGRESATANE